MDLRELIEHTEKFLDAIADMPEMDRTKREEQILELGRAFVDAVRRYERSDGSVTHVEETVTRVVRSANEVAGLAKRYIETNRLYDLSNLDADALAHFRKGQGK